MKNRKSILLYIFHMFQLYVVSFTICFSSILLLSFMLYYINYANNNYEKRQSDFNRFRLFIQITRSVCVPIRDA